MVQKRFICCRLGVVVIAGIVAAITSIGWSRTAYAADAPGATPKKRPQLLEWQVLLNPDAVERIRAVGKALPIKDVDYGVMLCDAAALRAAVADAAKQDDTAKITEKVNIFWVLYYRNPIDVSMPFYCNSPEGGPVLCGGGYAQVTTATNDDAISLNLKKMTLGMTWMPTFSRQPTFTMRAGFNASLKPRQSLALIGAVTSPTGAHYFHLLVLESIAADEQEMHRMPGDVSVSEWLENGPDAMMAKIDRSIVWQAEAFVHPSPFPAAFLRTLSDGKIVGLAKLYDAGTAYDCAWDPAGNPTDEFESWQTQSEFVPFSASVLYDVDRDEWEHASPIPQFEGRHFMMFPMVNEATAQVQPGAPIVVAVPVGPWRLLGEVSEQQPLTVDGQTYSLKLVERYDLPILTTLTLPRGMKDEISLTAILPSGEERDPLGISEVVMNGEYPSEEGVTFNLLDERYVKTYRVWIRKRESVTFSGYATRPLHLPPAPSTSELESAEQALARENIATLSGRIHLWHQMLAKDQVEGLRPNGASTATSATATRAQ